MTEPLGIPDVIHLWRVGAEIGHLRQRLLGVIGEPRWRINQADWLYLRMVTTSAGPAVTIDRLFGVPVDVVRPPDEQTFPQLVITVDRRVGWDSIKPMPPDEAGS